LLSLSPRQALLALAAAVFLFCFAAQLLLLRLTKRRLLRLLPLAVPAAGAALAACSMLLHWGDGGFFDLSALFAVFFLALALVGALGLLLAWGVWALVFRR